MRVFRRFRDVDIGNGCVLWCPFYKLDGGAAKAYDFSGAGNHGTIATPVRSALPRYGPNKVVNSTFATDTIWTKGAGWTINTVAAIAVAGVASDLEQDISAVNGETYLLQYSMSRTAGTVTPSIGATAGTARSATGYYSELITAAGPTTSNSARATLSPAPWTTLSSGRFCPTGPDPFGNGTGRRTWSPLEPDRH